MVQYWRRVAPRSLAVNGLLHTGPEQAARGCGPLLSQPAKGGKMTQTDERAVGDTNARDLTGTRAVVTGGTRGIGAAIAGTLARRGAEVLVSARNQVLDLPEGVRLVVA